MPDDVLRWGVTDQPLNSPVLLIALRGWFDTSSAATAALSHVTSNRAPTIIADIDPDPFYDFTQLRPEVQMDGDQQVITWPRNAFEAVRFQHTEHDIVALNGAEPHLRWRTYTDAILDVVREIDATAVVTLGAMPDAVPHTRRPPVVGSTPDPRLARRLGLSVPSYQGITGVIGALQEVLEREGIPAISLRVGIPHYLANARHPASSAALLAHVEHVLGVPLHSTALDAEIAEWREAHDAAVSADNDTSAYVRMLEADFDRRTEAAIPTADDLGAEFERYLAEGRSPDEDDEEP
jgi:proteasome assembly chaperone (PAC2) family protein